MLIPSTTCQRIVREIRACKEEHGATVATRSHRGTRHTTSEMTQSQRDCRSHRVASPGAVQHWIGSMGDDQCLVSLDLAASRHQDAQPNSTTPMSKRQQTTVKNIKDGPLFRISLLLHVMNYKNDILVFMIPGENYKTTKLKSIRRQNEN